MASVSCASVHDKSAVLKLLDQQAIEQICQDKGFVWRQGGKLPPGTTVACFGWQVLMGNVSCDAVSITARSGVYRRSLLHGPPEAAAGGIGSNQQRGGGRGMALAGVAVDAEHRWKGKRTFIIDGTGVSLPDSPQVRKHFGCSGKQKPGCGYPTAHVLLLCGPGGVAVDAICSPLRTGDMAKAGDLHKHLQEGDLLMGDRLFGGWGTCTCCKARSSTASSPLTTAADRLGGAGGSRAQPPVCFQPGLLRSTGSVPQAQAKAQAMSQKQLDSAPQWITVREVRRWVWVGGVRELITLVTTLIDATKNPAKELIRLLGKRWTIQSDLRAQDGYGPGAACLPERGGREKRADDVPDCLQPGAAAELKAAPPRACRWPASASPTHWIACATTRGSRREAAGDPAAARPLRAQDRQTQAQGVSQNDQAAATTSSRTQSPQKGRGLSLMPLGFKPVPHDGRTLPSGGDGLARLPRLQSPHISVRGEMAVPIVSIFSARGVPEADRPGGIRCAAGDWSWSRPRLSYGAAGLLTMPETRTRLKSLRGEQTAGPFTIHLANPSDAYRYLDPVDEYRERLIRKLWPGPVSLSFDVSAERRKSVAGELNLPEAELYDSTGIMLRCPDHIVATDIIAEARGPVAITTAGSADSGASWKPGRLPRNSMAGLSCSLTPAPPNIPSPRRC